VYCSKQIEKRSKTKVENSKFDDLPVPVLQRQKKASKPIGIAFAFCFHGYSVGIYSLTKKTLKNRKNFKIKEGKYHKKLWNSAKGSAV
jgi:4-aminobutyrate aminotransferase-like enzyme